MDKVYKEFGLTNKKSENSMLKNLYQPVKKDKSVNMPRFQYPDEGLILQADLLFMPDDDGYKYMLTVVDNGSRFMDAEPLKNKDNKSVIEAFKKIFSRKIVSKPKSKLEVDAGSEFKGTVAKYFTDDGIIVRVAAVGRHRQQALVEKANQTLGSLLHKRMAAQEIITGQQSKEWVDDLPLLIKLLNEHIKKRESKRKQKLDDLPNEPIAEGSATQLLEAGDKVRPALEYPVDLATGAKLHGKFRSSDIKWDPKPKVIKEVLLQPNQPPLYLLEGNVGDRKITPIAYTKNQLNVVGKNEKLPDVKLIRKEPKQWIVEKIVGKKKLKNKIYFKVRWKGFQEKDDTFEPRATLIKEIPELVAEFEKKK